MIKITGIEISVIILAIFIGVALVFAVKSYDEISYKKGKIKFKRKVS